MFYAHKKGASLCEDNAEDISVYGLIKAKGWMDVSSSVTAVAVTVMQALIGIVDILQRRSWPGYELQQTETSSRQHHRRGHETSPSRLHHRGWMWRNAPPQNIFKWALQLPKIIVSLFLIILDFLPARKCTLSLIEITRVKKALCKVFFFLNLIHFNALAASVTAPRNMRKHFFPPN